MTIEFLFCYTKLTIQKEKCFQFVTKGWYAILMAVESASFYLFKCSIFMPMSRTILFGLLNLVGFYLLFNWLYQLVKEYKIRDAAHPFFTLHRFRYIVLLVVSIGVPFFLLNYTPYFEDIHINIDKSNFAFSFLFCGALAFITSLIWLDYILKLDLHEKSKKHYVWLVFILSIFFTQYLTDPLYNLVRESGLT